MKDSKSRKPAAEAAQKKRPHANSFDGNATAKKSKFAEGPKPHTTTEQHAARLSKKERKQLSRDRKSRTNKNYNLILEVVGMWETLRRHDTPPARRSEIVTAILKKIDGRVAELAGSHAASRVVQAAIKHGTPQERTSIFKQLQSSLVDLAKSPYGRFVVSKLIDLASKDELQVFIKAFKGRAAELLRHPAGTHVLDDLYLAASSTQRNALASEFYGREYSLFGEGTLNNTEGAPVSLSTLLSAVDASKRRSIIQHLAKAIYPVIEKGLVDCQLAHRLVAEYLEAGPASLVVDAVETLSGEALLHMLHTHDGVKAACMVFAYGTAKDRKKALKAMKGHVAAAVMDEWGHLAILTALSVTDDTQMLRKSVVAEILQNDLEQLVGHKAAHRVILQILHPDCPRYLPPSLRDIVHPAPKTVTVSLTTTTTTDDTDEDEDRNDDDENEENEEEKAKKEVVAGGSVLGLSKKDAMVRRQELLQGGLGEALIALCKESGPALIRTQYASLMVEEVLCGGGGGALEGVVGVEAVDAVHDAILNAALTEKIEDEGEDTGTESVLLCSYFGSRAVRRVVLAGAVEPAAQRFTEKLWNRVLKGRCKELYESHGAKVIAAVVHSGGGGIGVEVRGELKKSCRVKNPDEWANKFLQKS